MEDGILPRQDQHEIELVGGQYMRMSPYESDGRARSAIKSLDDFAPGQAQAYQYVENTWTAAAKGDPFAQRAAMAMCPYMEQSASGSRLLMGCVWGSAVWNPNQGANGFLIGTGQADLAEEAVSAGKIALWMLAGVGVLFGGIYVYSKIYLSGRRSALRDWDNDEVAYSCMPAWAKSELKTGMR